MRNVILAIFGVSWFLFSFLAITIAWYIFSSFGLYSLSKNNGQKDKAFFAFVPFAKNYLLGLLCGDISLFGRDISANKLGLLLAILPILIWIPFAGVLLGIFCYILYYYALNKIYRNIDEDSSTLMIILSILFPIVVPIYLFIKRNTIFYDTTIIDL